MWVRPWLHRSHPNFAVALYSTAIFHVWSGYNGLFTARSTAPALVRVDQFASPRTWGYASLVVAVVIGVGLCRSTFTVTRIGLAVGLAVMLCRMALVVQASMLDKVAIGNGAATLFVVCANHLAQTLEPPVNPMSSR